MPTPANAKKVLPGNVLDQCAVTAMPYLAEAGLVIEDNQASAAKDSSQIMRPRIKLLR
jgi:hypothetical protein